MSTSRVPLRCAQLLKPMTAYSLYTDRHDKLVHDSPPGLRLTLVDGHSILVEGPAHEKDQKRPEGVNLRIPVSLVFYMEDLVPLPHRLDPKETATLMKFGIERREHLAEVEPEPIKPPPQNKLPAPKLSKKQKEKLVETGVQVGGTQDETALLEDDAADEAAELLEDLRKQKGGQAEPAEDADDE